MTKDVIIRFLFISLWLSFTGVASAQPSNWEDIKVKGEGEVHFYWYPNNLNIADSKDIIDGVEHDLATAFIKFTEDEFNVTLNYRWLETNSFQEVLSTVREAGPGTFGASSISITEERSKTLAFTPPYLTDVAVLITNDDIRLAQTIQEFVESLRGKKAVTIQSTTLEKALLELQEGIDFSMTYVQNSGQLIETIEEIPGAFGYVDLPNFLVALNHNAKIRRQFFTPIKLEGLAFIYSLESDWKEPIRRYFNSDQFIEDRDSIIANYLGDDATEIIERIARSADLGPMEEIALSNREKELQYQELLATSEREQQRIRSRNWLILATVSLCLIALFFYFSYRQKSRSNQKLETQRAQIQEQNDRLEALNKEKNDLIEILAHDLRSPLANIRGYSSMLSEERDMNPETRKMTNYIEKASLKMERMIAKILDVEAIESGEVKVQNRVVNLETIIKNLVEYLEPRFRQKDIELQILGNTKHPVVADPFYLSQSLENLLTNALKFSERGKKVLLQSNQTKENKILIEVVDEGPGISLEDQSKLFGKYQKLTAKPTAGESSIGLGLSIVKSCIEAMNGTITVQSELGKGTSFLIQLDRPKGAVMEGPSEKAS